MCRGWWNGVLQHLVMSINEAAGNEAGFGFFFSRFVSVLKRPNFSNFFSVLPPPPIQKLL